MDRQWFKATLHTLLVVLWSVGVAGCQGPREHAPSVDSGPLTTGNDGPSGGSQPSTSAGGQPGGGTAGQPGSGTAGQSGSAGGAGGPSSTGTDGPVGGGGASGSTGTPDGAPTASVDADPSAPQPVCGNGMVETGEECDPPGTCPASCPNKGCTKFVRQGDPAKCTARCVEMGALTACTDDDGCCPATCNATNDRDCNVKCDNGVKEGKETCDPLSSCPTSCPPMGCQLRKLVNGGTCTAECVNDRQQTACMSGDGCCPSSCNHNNDGDCPPCGGSGQMCCGGTCNGANLSCQGGKCAACGGNGDPCCGGSCTGAMLSCQNGKCASCGGTNQPCCPGNSCGSGLTCDGKTCVVPCGDNGQNCCANGSCNDANLACSASKCRSCGASGQPCCGGSRCNGSNLSCQGNQCAACGGNGQACCDTTGCSGGLVCQGGKCQPPCGHDGEACCTESSCLGGLGCNGSGRCQTKLANGANCKGVPESLCQTGNCVDNVCCKSASCSPCSKCGSSGNCDPLPDGTQVSGCNGTKACDGAGNCKSTLIKDGMQCRTDSNGNNLDSSCESNYCNRAGFCQPCGALNQNCCTSGNVACKSGFRCENNCPNNMLDPRDKDFTCVAPQDVNCTFVCPLTNDMDCKPMP
jgi:hypothetical protein